MDARSKPHKTLLREALATRRLHSAYLLAGPQDATRPEALAFARGSVCRGEHPPCETCGHCSRSRESEDSAPVLDGTGKKGPLLRHIGDHPDLLWVERGPDDTRVRIGQVRALQQALQLRGSGDGHRLAVIADAEWLNQEAQNALLRLLEEPPRATTLVLLATRASGLLATVRSRCQRVALAAPRRRLERESLSEEARVWIERLDNLRSQGVPALLDWAEDFRGPRGPAAAAVTEFLAWASLWLRDVVGDCRSGANPKPALRAFADIQAARKALAQRNANPQMVAERALFALHAAAQTRG